MNRIYGVFLTVLFSFLLAVTFSLRVVAAESFAEGWTKTYGATGDDGACTVVHTDDGGYAIAGTINYSFLDYGDFWLIKTDANGNVLWNMTYGGTNDEFAYSVVQTNDEGYAIAGTTSSYGAGNQDYWLIKTDAYGNAQWNETYGTTSSDFGYSMIQTDDGGYTIAGYTESYGAGGKDFWLVKTDASGVILELPSNTVPMVLMITVTLTTVLMKKKLRINPTSHAKTLPLNRHMPREFSAFVW